MYSSMRVAGVAILISTCLAGSAQAFDWSGFYAGFNLGYSQIDTKASYDNSGLATFAGPLDMSPAGVVGGVQLGANQALGNGLVVGIEGDANLAGLTATIDDVAGNANHPLTGPHYISSTTDFYATLRGRIGFDAGMLMPYLTAGAIAGHATVHATDGDLNDSAILYGWTAGIGTEVAVSDSATLKAEYLYSDLGSHQWFAGQAYSSTSHTTTSAVRVGLNFKLN